MSTEDDNGVNSDVFHLSAISVDGGRLVADHRWTPGFHVGDDEDLTINDVTAVDFDEDGTDELVQVSTNDRRGFIWKTLDVFALDGAKLANGLSIAVEYDDSGSDPAVATSCAATWRISAPGSGKRSLLVDGTTFKNERCVPIKQRYEMRGKVFVDAQ